MVSPSPPLPSSSAAKSADYDTTTPPINFSLPQFNLTITTTTKNHDQAPPPGQEEDSSPAAVKDSPKRDSESEYEYEEIEPEFELEPEESVDEEAEASPKRPRMWWTKTIAKRGKNIGCFASSSSSVKVKADKDKQVQVQGDQDKQQQQGDEGKLKAPPPPPYDDDDAADDKLVAHLLYRWFEYGEVPRVSLSLSPEEIEHDFIQFTGSKPPPKP